MANDLPLTMPDPGDTARIVEYCNRTIWDAYQDLRQPYLRQIEANVRALAGRQYDEYVPEAGGFVDLSELFASEDDKWRRKPVFNWLAQQWYQVKLAKLTENAPILGCLPASSDATDGMTAAIFESFFRYYWDRLSMPELVFPLTGWVLTAGEAVLFSRWDPDTGEVYEYAQDAVGPDQTPKADGHVPALLQKTGDLDVEVICPASVLWPYGPTPHWKAPWVMREYWLPVEEVNNRWEVDLKPDSIDPRSDLALRLQYTSFYGNSGSPGGGWGGGSGWGGGVATRDMIRVRERWARATAEYPYGRLTLVTGTTVLDDGINPYVIPGYREKVVIPFARFQRPGFPFRQEGTSDLENLTPLARERNRALAGCGDFVAHNEQPPMFVNRNLVADDQLDKLHRVGAKVQVDGDPQRAAAYVNQPQLPLAGQQWAALLREEMETMGHAAPSEATTPNDTRSGELLQQSRYDNDRPDGSTVRLHSYEWARVGQQWMDIAAACMEDERTLAIAGEGQALEFLTVRPELMQGRINVYPVPDAAILESRTDKQNRVAQALGTAAQLAAVNPAWSNQFLATMGYQDLQRFQTGGEAMALAKRQIAEMVQTGMPVPIFPEQDHAVHVEAVVGYMQTLSFRNLDPQRQAVLRLYKLGHETLGAQQMALEAGKAAAVAEATASLTGMPSPSGMAQQQVEQQRAESEAKTNPPLKRVK